MDVIDTVAEVADVATSIYEIASMQLGEIHCQLVIAFVNHLCSASAFQYDKVKSKEEMSSNDDYMMKKTDLNTIERSWML